MNRLLSLVALVISVWLSLVFGLFIVLRVIFEMTLPWQGVTPLVLAILRVGLSAIMVLGWLFGWQRIVQKYLWRSLTARHTNRATSPSM
ncbi:MAG: hypothetical protein V1857_00050 [archaeon]